MSAGVVLNQVRRGFYLDSVALMRLSAEIAALPEVDEAVLMIGSESNRQIMEDAGLLQAEGREAGANDLVIAVRAAREASARAAVDQAVKGLDGPGASARMSESRPRTLSGAMAELPQANLALISTPGAYAAREARAALERGLNVMIFSDNVPVEAERALKEQAAGQGLLVMGPDCGTAYIAGTPLAFANIVPTGDIGVIAASGTGLQEFAVLVSRLGGGIRHGIGVGGRDLGDGVGGLSTLSAIELLAADEKVARIVLISKPPGTDTARRVFRSLAACGKPVTACVFGVQGSLVPGEVFLAPTLKAAAEHCCGMRLPSPGIDLDALAMELSSTLAPGRRGILGLFCGGTLCTEAQVVLRGAGLAPGSNAPLPGGGGADEDVTVTDLGADEYTIGRPHPMIDPQVRQPLLERALSDPGLAVVLLDVVLGLGAHEDPAASVVAAMAGAPSSRPLVIASVCGSDQDPQGLHTQVDALRAAGVVVMPSNADAAAMAARVVTKPS